MRRTSVVATAALIAALALAGLPASAGSTTPSIAREPAPAAFTTITVPAPSPVPAAQGMSDLALRSDGYVGPATAFTEPGVWPAGPTSRPQADQPPVTAGEDRAAPRYTISGYATFYDNGTTAMRLPRGTVVRICGDGGCIERTVTDYGPVRKIRIVDLYRPDFFEICGCPWFSGTTWVTVSVY